jgi:hypothetical protein
VRQKLIERVYERVRKETRRAYESIRTNAKGVSEKEKDLKVRESEKERNLLKSFHLLSLTLKFALGKYHWTRDVLNFCFFSLAILEKILTILLDRGALSLG